MEAISRDPTQTERTALGALSLRVMSFTENFYRSRDGLQLYYRDYAGDARKAPVLCLHGLTRNSRDFAALAEHIAPARRVIVPDQRGRGRSQYDTHWLNYHPGTYVDDMWTLLRELSLERVIVVGTSLGGLMAMLMAAMRPQMLAGVGVERYRSRDRPGRRDAHSIVCRTIAAGAQLGRCRCTDEDDVRSGAA